MARAALSRRAVSGNVAHQQGDACLLFDGKAGHLRPVRLCKTGHLDGKKWPVSNEKAWHYSDFEI